LNFESGHPGDSGGSHGKSAQKDLTDSTRSFEAAKSSAESK